MRDKVSGTDLTRTKIWEKLKSPFKKRSTQSKSSALFKNIEVYTSASCILPDIITLTNVPTKPLSKAAQNNSSIIDFQILNSMDPIKSLRELIPIAIQPIDICRFTANTSKSNETMTSSSQISRESSINKVSIIKLSRMASNYKRRSLFRSVENVYSRSTSSSYSSVPFSPFYSRGSATSITFGSRTLQPSRSLGGSDSSLVLNNGTKKEKNIIKSKENMKQREHTINPFMDSIHTKTQKTKKPDRVIETSTIYVQEEKTALVSTTGDYEHSQKKVNQYHLLKDIGSGAYGRVVLCRHDETGRYYACKIMSKSRLKKKFRYTGVVDHLRFIQTEIAILKKLSKHRNINALVEVLEDGKEDNLYMIFELCEFGAVMNIDVGVHARPFSEELARKYMRDIVHGLEFMHHQKIIHRDIKTENLLLNADGTVQITDFGISHMFEDNVDDPLLENKNSSPLYSPPEICEPEVKHFKGKAVDIWSLGVTLYCLLHGHFPFEDKNVIVLYDKIVNDKPIVDSGLSADAADLISRMLDKNPESRINLNQIKDHDWMTLKGSLPMMSTEENCEFEKVTQEEVDNAYKPAMMFFNKFLKKLKKNPVARSVASSTGEKRKNTREVRVSKPLLFAEKSDNFGSAGTVFSLQKTESAGDLKESLTKIPSFHKDIYHHRQGSSSTMPTSLSNYYDVKSKALVINYI